MSMLLDEVWFEITRPVRRGPAGTTSRAKLQRAFEVAEFHAEASECCEGIDNESTAVAGVVIALFGNPVAFESYSRRRSDE